MFNRISILIFTAGLFWIYTIVFARHDEHMKSCHCGNYTCGCCSHLEEHKVHLNATVCINATYLKNDYGLSVVLTFNKYVVFNETVSARNPPPICIGAPYLERYVELCARFYDLEASKKRFHGCLEAEVSLMKVDVAKYHLGCLDIGHLHELMDIENELNFTPSVILLS